MIPAGPVPNLIPVRELQPLLDACDSLDHREHPGVTTLAQGLRRKVDSARDEAVIRDIQEIYESISWDLVSCSASDILEVADRIAAAMSGAARPGVVVSRLISWAKSSGGSTLVAQPPEVPREDFCDPSAMQQRHIDAAAMHQAVVAAGNIGIAQRDLARDLGRSRRAAALRVLKLSGRVSVSQVPNPAAHPAHLVWLTANPLTPA